MLKRAVVKANFDANFNVYLGISDAETLDNSSNQCSAMFSHISVYFKVTGLQ